MRERYIYCYDFYYFMEQKTEWRLDTVFTVFFPVPPSAPPTGGAEGVQERTVYSFNFTFTYNLGTFGIFLLRRAL